MLDTGGSEGRASRGGDAYAVQRHVAEGSARRHHVQERGTAAGSNGVHDRNVGDKILDNSRPCRHPSVNLKCPSGYCRREHPVGVHPSPGRR